MTSVSAAQRLGEKALALQGSGQHDKAVELVRLHLRMRPKDSMALSIMGVLLRGVGALVESEEWLRRAITLEPDNATCHYHLGVTLAMAKRHRDAIAHWEIAARLLPNFGAPWIALTGAYADVNEAERGIEAAQIAMRLAPGEPGSRANLALALAKAGRTEEACEMYRMVVENSRAILVGTPTICSR